MVYCSEDKPPWGKLARMGGAENLPASTVVAFGPFRLYPAERLLERGEATLLLGGRALDVLMALIERAEEVMRVEVSS